MCYPDVEHCPRFLSDTCLTLTKLLLDGTDFWIVPPNRNKRPACFGVTVGFGPTEEIVSNVQYKR